MSVQIDALGDELYGALVQCRPVSPLTSRGFDLGIEDAYRIQQRMIARRMEQGARIVGKKIGLTSRVVQQMLGVDQPDFGQLLDVMTVPSGGTADTRALIQPKAEGEIAFVLKKDLSGPGVTAADVWAATEGVMACFEIVDSRIRDWKITIADTVADNASAGMFALGDQLVDARLIDLAQAGMVLEKNGEIVATGTGAAALGHPVNCVVWLANRLGALGMGIRAGEIVLSGSLAAMVPVAAGDYLKVTIGGIGSCSVRFV